MKGSGGVKINRWTLIAGILLITSVSGLVPLAGFSRWVLNPLTGGLNRLGQNLASWGNADEELAAENQRLQQQLVRQLEIERENQQLRAELNFNQRSQLNTLGADIINYQPDSVRNFIRISRGSNDGIKLGQAVISEGRLVGAISGISPHQSEVMLITDGEFRALTKSLKDQVPGIVKGYPPAGIKMERIPKPQSLLSTELIVTSGLDGQFPAGLIVGKVLSTHSDQEAIFQTAELEPAVNVLQLKVVNVVIN